MKLIKETLEAIMKSQKINIKDISTENKPFLYGLLNTMEDLSEKANKQTKEYEKMFLKIQRISENITNKKTACKIISKEISSLNIPHSKQQKNNCKTIKFYRARKILIVSLLILVILFASLFGAFAFSSDFRHAAVEVFEDDGDDYSRVSSASADRGTADAVTFTFINYTAINCKGGRKGMEASFLAKP